MLEMHSREGIALAHHPWRRNIVDGKYEQSESPGGADEGPFRGDPAKMCAMFQRTLSASRLSTQVRSLELY